MAKRKIVLPYFYAKPGIKTTANYCLNIRRRVKIWDHNSNFQKEHDFFQADHMLAKRDIKLFLSKLPKQQMSSRILFLKHKVGIKSPVYQQVGNNFDIREKVLSNSTFDVVCHTRMNNIS